MTIQELINCVLKGEEMTDGIALQCFLAISGALRSFYQGKPATFEGECAGVLAVMESTPYGPTVAGLKLFMEECPNVLKIEVPDSVLLQWVKADGDE